MYNNLANLLVAEEQTLGQYQVSIARHSGERWTPTVPPLIAIITNFRLILQPQTMKVHKPASIPSYYVIKINHVILDRHDGVQMVLRTGHVMNMFVAVNRGENFVEMFKQVCTPPWRKRFIPRTSHDDIRKLITFVRTI